MTTNMAVANKSLDYRVMMLTLCLGMVAMVSAAHKDAALKGYKDQYCTDPRTMRKHAAYTEWADAYSCSRHRCQPGGRNLAIYTVGCKRVEAPESAIECEEVVEDTNMQFPFCCTRLRCLVVVRGEVWTRVLGQPWEVLPAAPWSHMYKMKKPPPSDTAFSPKTTEVGPIYELTEPEGDSEGKKASHTRKQAGDIDPAGSDCNEVVPRALPGVAPDIVIALSTNSDKDLNTTSNDIIRHKRGRKSVDNRFAEVEDDAQESEVTDKPLDFSEEKYAGNNIYPKEKTSHKQIHPNPWAIPQNQWNEHDGAESDQKSNIRQPMALELRYPDPKPQNNYIEKEKKEDIPESKHQPNKNFQALVDAIGSRMKDIENVVKRMTEKVKDTKSTSDSSSEKRYTPRTHESVKYHGTDSPGDPKIDDTNYFSDPSNVMRRSLEPKEPSPDHATYMAPVDSYHKSPHSTGESSEDVDKKKKKHIHKKKKNKAHIHKKHHTAEKRKRFKISSTELDKNGISLEDSSAVVA